MAHASAVSRRPPASAAQQGLAESPALSFRIDAPLPPLFCACGAGARPSDYQDLALALPKEQPVHVLGMPPFAAHDGLPTVQQLAASYVGQLRKWQPHGPYRLCGHSFGGLVVFEMAVLLAAAGEEIGFLGLIDTLQPDFMRHMTARERMLFRTKYVADRLGKYARYLCGGRLDRLSREAFVFVSRRCRRLAWKMAGSLFGGLSRPVPDAIRSDKLALAAAWHNYEPSKYTGDLVLLNAVERTPEYGRDPSLGWKYCVAGAIDIHVVPGNHVSIVHQPHVRTLAQRMTPYLVKP